MRRVEHADPDAATPRPLRVLKVANVARSENAGMSRQMLRTGDALESLGHEVTYLWASDLSVGVVPPKLMRFVGPVAVAIKGARRRRHIDVVEIHEPSAWAYVLLRKIRRSLPPVVIMSHGLEERGWQAACTYGPTPSIARRAWIWLSLLGPSRLGLRSADQVIVLNDDDEHHLTALRKIPADRVTVARNGVDACAGEATPSVDGILRCLFLGSWIPRKGSQDLLSVVELLKEDPHVSFTLAGVGPLDLAHGSIVPAYSREELATLLATHDVLIAPSWFEGGALAVLEAMACGLAVIGTPTGVLPELAAQGAAVLVPIADPLKLRDAIVQLAGDTAGLKQLQHAARDVAIQHTWRRTAQAQEDAYRSAMER